VKIKITFPGNYLQYGVVCIENQIVSQGASPVFESATPRRNFNSLNSSVLAGISSGLPGQQRNVGTRRNIL
jgi:hypothetical protein